MSKQISSERERGGAEAAADETAKTEHGSAACAMQAEGWLKGALGMAVCCGAPLLLFAAIGFFGLSLGAIASGALSLLALLVCPIVMSLMMRASITEMRKSRGEKP